ncbi:MAG TPA: SDR family NAD(P)-dependent oxidoreductase, partial [Polyangiaceae bacterium]
MSRRPQGLSLSELAQLRRDGDSALTAGDAPYFLVVERLEELQDHETLALTRDLVTSGAPAPTTARVFAVVGERPPWIHLGRSIDADIWLDDPTVSKLHLRFRGDGQAMTVSDLGSQNGTKLNGTRLDSDQEAPLRPGDVLEISERYRATFVGAETLLARLERVSSEKTELGSRSGNGILAGKVAVITGGGRGLGRAYALRFAEEGCRVVVNDIGAPPCGLGTDATVAPSVVAEIEQAGGTAIASLHDVASRAEVDA